MGQINLIKTILGNGDPKKPRLPVHPLEKNPDVPPSVEPQARPLQPLQQQPIQQPVEAAPQTAPQGLVEQDPYESARKDYETAVAAKAEKQPLWKQVLFMGLQAVQQIATERPQPYQLLGNAKKNYAVQQAAGRYIPLEEQRQRQLETQQRRSQIETLESQRKNAASKAAMDRFNDVFGQRTKDDDLDDADVAVLTPLATAAGVPPPTKGSWRSYQIDYDADGNQIRIPKTGTGNPEKTGIAKPKEGTAYFDGLPMKPSEAGDLKVRREEFNARGAFDANKENANNELEAAKANATNTLNYQKELFNRIQAVGDTSKKSADVLKDAADLMAKAEKAMEDGEYEAAERYAKQAEAKAKHADSFSGVINQMNAAGITRPATIKPRKIAPRVVGKPVSAAKDPHGYFR